MALMENNLEVFDTKLGSTDNSLHSKSKLSSPKNSSKLDQTATEWQIMNFFKSMDICQTNQISHQYDTVCQNNSSIIVISDDSSLQGDSESEPKVILVSDSDSECLSLPDLEEPFFPPLKKAVSHLSFTEQNIDDVELTPFPLNLDFTTNNGYSKESSEDSLSFFHLETKDNPTNNVICLSEDSFHSYSNDVAYIKIESEVALNNHKKTLKEGTCEKLEKYSTSSDCSEENGFLNDCRNDFLKDTSQYIYTIKENNGSYSLISPTSDSKGDANHSIPLPAFVNYTLPYSLQPYTNDTNLGVKDLEDQPQLTVELLQSCLEEGKLFPLFTADIHCLYLYVYRPAKKSLEDLLKWLQQSGVEITLENDGLLSVPCFKLFGLLNDLFYFYPENTSILWEAVCNTMFTVPLEKMDISSDFVFMLEIYLNVLEGDFYRIKDPKNCQVYRHMANGNSYSNIKKIIQWLSQVIATLIDQNISLAEQLLCQLEKLLELCVVVSQENAILAKRIAKDLVAIYLSIPYLKVRQRFLSSIQSELIRFKFLEILLEKYCDGTKLDWIYMPEGFVDIAQAFFQATPLETNLAKNSIKSVNNTSPSQCEELIMFLYFVIITYLASIKGPFCKNLPISSDVEELFDNDYVSPMWSHQLKDFSLYISQLNRHIRNLNVELTKESLLYLWMIDHLTDLIEEDLTLSVF